MEAKAIIGDDATVRGFLERAAEKEPERVYLRFGDEPVTCAELNRRVNRLARGLAALGLAEGERVAVMLDNHPDHVATVLALFKLGITWVPLNVQLKGPSLVYILGHSQPKAVIADAAHADQLVPALAEVAIDIVVWRGTGPAAGGARTAALSALAAPGPAAAPARTPRSDDLLCIIYTSGTTGAPKGVPLTDKMFRAAAYATLAVTEPNDGDVMLVWEPIYHIGGSQMLVAALLRPITIALLDRFSASQFWDQARRYGATHIHYLGAILGMLLAQPPSATDRDHKVRIAWGGGCTEQMWRPFERRFGVQIREDYGMTEASSFTTVNPEGRFGSIGRALPYFEVRIADDDGRPLPPGKTGEIQVRAKEPGVIMAGYFRNPEATAATLKNGWLHTGDLGRCDEEGFFYYSGRKKDSLRRRGENISAWEVERIVNDHPDVDESAVVGVPSELGEDEVKVFVRTLDGRPLDPAELVRWCDSRMPKFQVPRFVAFIDRFEKTPTHRIRKETLSRATDDCWDREVAGRSGARAG